MRKGMFRNRIGVLLGALVAAGAIAAVGVGASSATAAEDEPRILTGAFCGGLCISLAFDEAVTTSSNPTDFNLRPGTYLLTVNDDNRFHNFALRSPDGTEQAITGIPETPGVVTVKILLKKGTYRLLCQNPNHPTMWVDFEVGGVGQVG